MVLDYVALVKAYSAVTSNVMKHLTSVVFLFNVCGCALVSLLTRAYSVMREEGIQQ